MHHRRIPGTCLRLGELTAASARTMAQQRSAVFFSTAASATGGACVAQATLTETTRHKGAQQPAQSVCPHMSKRNCLLRPLAIAWSAAKHGQRGAAAARQAACRRRSQWICRPFTRIITHPFSWFCRFGPFEAFGAKRLGTFRTLFWQSFSRKGGLTCHCLT